MTPDPILRASVAAAVRLNLVRTPRTVAWIGVQVLLLSFDLLPIILRATNRQTADQKTPLVC